MKKSDLKSGMVVKLREYDKLYILIGDVFCSYNGKAFISLNKYDDELRYTFYIDEKEMDITEVYKCKYPNIMSCFIENKLELVWKREEVEKEVEYTDYRQAIKYDKDLCTTIAMEECAELIQAISKAKRGKLDKDNLAEEIEDVMISLTWIQDIYDISDEDLIKWRKFKEKRIVERLNTGEFK